MERRERSAVDRRTVVRTTGLGVALALAGCLGDGGEGAANGDSGDDEIDEDDGSGEDDGNDGEPADGDDGERNESDAAASFPEATDEPATVPEDADCAVCMMPPARFPDWNAQIAHEDGERAFLCGAGCFTVYVAAPETFAETDAAFDGAWVREFEAGDRLDAREASYVLEWNPDRNEDEPMVNPAVFGDRADAESYAESVDLGADDIVGWEGIDRDVAAIYNEYALENGPKV